MKNRSVPVDTVLPHVAYRDLTTAIDWLVKHFGFVEQYHYTDSTTGKIAGAQLRLANAYIMVHAAKAASASTPSELGYNLQSLTIFFDDVDAHHRKVKSTGILSSNSFTRPFTVNCSTRCRIWRGTSGFFRNMRKI